MSDYTTDGKGNVYNAATGKRVWSGDPQDVVALLEERDRLERWVEMGRRDKKAAEAALDTMTAAWSEQRQMTNEWMQRALRLKVECNKVQIKLKLCKFIEAHTDSLAELKASVAEMERDQARAEVERLRQIVFKIADAGFEAAHEREAA